MAGANPCLNQKLNYLNHYYLNSTTITCWSAGPIISTECDVPSGNHRNLPAGISLTVSLLLGPVNFTVIASI